MKRIASLVFIFVSTLALLAADNPVSVAGVSVQPQPATSTASPEILVTSILGEGISGGAVSQLDDLEIYNQSSVPINLNGWSFTFTVKGSGSCANGLTATVAFPNGWLLAKDYFTFVHSASPKAPGEFSVDPGFLTGCTGAWLSAITVLQAGSAEQTITIPEGAFAANKPLAQQKQRNNSASSARTLTGIFTAASGSYDYTLSQPNTVSLYSDPLYMPPADTAGLQIVELLANSENCDPTDTSLVCSDFVKLFNASAKPIDLSAYRLRVSYGGNKSTSSNTVTLNGSLAPEAYAIVNTKNDGSPLSLTESGGYAWLEDAYGATIYQPIISYPDASSSTKVGWAWAFDGSSWRWASAPTTDANDFPAPDTQTLASSTSASTTPQPCAPNQYRNPATNRCKLIVSATTLVPCKPGETRNPATNRCRSPLATPSLTPCKPGQERNPATNRCRSITTSGSTLKPCQAGWTRSQQTNRCRKDTATKVANVQDIKTAAKSDSGRTWQWLLGIIIVAVAAGYALYEWRRDALLLIDGTKLKFSQLIAKWRPLRTKKNI